MEDEDDLIKDNWKIWKWIFLIESVILAAYIVSKYAS